MKKYVAGVLTGIILMLSVTVFAEETMEKIDVIFGKVQVMLNGEKVDKETVLINGTTYLPLRAMAEMLNLEVSYDEATSTAYLDNAGTSRAFNDIVKDKIQGFDLTAGDEVPLESFKTVREYMASPFGSIVTEGLSEASDSLDGMGELIIDATDNELIFEFKFLMDLTPLLSDSSLEDYLNSAFDSMPEVYSSLADSLKLVVDQDPIKVTVKFTDEKGNTLFSRTYSSK